jgi:N-acyl-D-aspartate/D-glutamate deacylase
VQRYDVLIRGGAVLDPSQGLHQARDVALAYGRVAAVVQSGDIDAATAAVVVDAAPGIEASLLPAAR